VASLLAARYRRDDSGARVARAIQEDRPISAAPGSAGGDWRHLRGLPLITRTVGGSMLGSRPEREILKLDRRKF
jgi:hypothetical protein